MWSIHSIKEARRQRLYEEAIDAGISEEQAARLAEIGAAEYAAEVEDERADRARDQRIDDMLTGDRR